MNCDKCGKEITPPDHLGTGYGITDTGEKICYVCCGLEDAAYMQTHDQTVLYLVETQGKWEVTNWPGTLRFKTGTPKQGKHNMAHVRYDVWFKDHTGGHWWGVQYGNWTQVVHCKKVQPWEF